MTLLTHITDVSDEVGLTRPATVVSNTDVGVQRLLRLSNKVGKRLMRQPKEGWQILRKEHTYTSVAAEEQIADVTSTVSDFDRFVAETHWDRTDNNLVAGPISPLEWQTYQALNYTDTLTPKFIYRGKSLRITPTMASGKSMAFEYVSKNWCESSGGTGQAEWAADTDVSLIDEELLTLGVVYASLSAEGLPSAAALSEFEECLNDLWTNDQPDAEVMTAGDIFGGGRHYGVGPASDGLGGYLWAGLT